MFRGKNAKYTIGRAYDDINGENNQFINYANLFDYKDNGFRFDLNVLTNGGKTINTLEQGIGYLDYSFFKTVKTDSTTVDIPVKDIQSMGNYDPSTDAWSFTAEPGDYKVEISINPLFVPKKLVEDEIIKPIVFEFTLDNSINVYTHEQFKAIFANTKIGESLRTGERVTRGISLHSNIEASIDDNQYFDTTSPNNPLLPHATDAKKAGHTPITMSQNPLWENCENENFAHGSVYKRFSKKDLYETYVINGNCFEMDGSNLPFASIYAFENLSTVSGYEIASVHMALIHYIVSNGNGDDEVSHSELTVNNLKITGNTKKYNSEADGSTIEAMNRNSGGYLGIMGTNGVTLNVNNSIIQNTTVALNPSSEASLYVSTTVVKNCFSNAIYSWDNGDVIVRNCYFEDAGGAAIHVEDTESYERVDGTGSYSTTSIVDIDAYTEINNYVSGDEGFFKSRSFEILITGMKAQFQAGATENGMTMIEKITDPATGLETEKINLIMLAVPRGDNADDKLWDIDKYGNRNYDGGIFKGTHNNMTSIKFGDAQTIGLDTYNKTVAEQVTDRVIAEARELIKQGIIDQFGALPEEQLNAAIDTEIAKEEHQTLIKKNIKEQLAIYQRDYIDTKFLANVLGGNDILPLTNNTNNINDFGSGYMLTAYDIPTFGNSIIVTGVKGLPETE